MIYLLQILNPSLQPVATFFDFLSCIWTTQYFAPGEFELVVDYSEENLTALAAGNYIVKNNTNEIAIIEKVRYEYSPNEGGKITATGRMAISLLDRRLMYSYNTTTHNPYLYSYCYPGESVEDAARRTVTQQAITPTAGGTARQINNLVLGTDHGYADTAGRRVSTQLNLYTALTALLASKNMAHRIIYDSTNAQLVYEVFKGTDRSASMVFSRQFENLLSFAYEYDTSNFKSLAYIGGEGEGLQRFMASTSINGGGTQNNRREVFYDASSDREDGMSNADYSALIRNEAKQQCRELANKKTVEAEIDLINSGFVFGEDYNVGDIILIRDIIDFTPRITTVIESQSGEGYTVDVEFNEDAPAEEDA